MQALLNKKIADKEVIKVVLEDLAAYWQRAKAAHEKDTKLDKSTLVISHYSHADHTKERLNFIRFVAKITTDF